MIAGKRKKVYNITEVDYMKTKNYLIIVGVFLVTIITLSIILITRPNVENPDENISDELREVLKTFECRLSSDKSYYIIYGLKNYENRRDEIRIPSSIDDIPVKKLLDEKTLNFIYLKNVKKIYIPETITYIGTSDKDNGLANKAFLSSTGINEIIVDENNPVYSSDNGILYNKDKTILIRYPISKVSDDNLVINFIDSVTEIYSYAFAMNNALLTVNFSEKITKIGSGAFYKCSNLVNINFNKQNNIKTIQAYAFEDCRSLIDVTIANGVESLGSSSFRGCINLYEIYLPKSLHDYGSHIFTGANNLEKVYTEADNIDFLKGIIDDLSLNKNAVIVEKEN